VGETRERIRPGPRAVLEVPEALGQGRTPEEVRKNVLDALCTVLTSDDELSRRAIILPATTRLPDLDRSSESRCSPSRSMDA
jgi:hypothetical protein